MRKENLTGFSGMGLGLRGEVFMTRDGDNRPYVYYTECIGHWREAEETDEACLWVSVQMICDTATMRAVLLGDEEHEPPIDLPAEQEYDVVPWAIHNENLKQALERGGYKVLEFEADDTDKMSHWAFFARFWWIKRSQEEKKRKQEEEERRREYEKQCEQMKKEQEEREQQKADWEHEKWLRICKGLGWDPERWWE